MTPIKQVLGVTFQEFEALYESKYAVAVDPDGSKGIHIEDIRSIISSHFENKSSIVAEEVAEMMESNGYAVEY